MLSLASAPVGAVDVLTDTPYKNACVAASIIGDQHRVTDTGMKVTAPDEVAPGATFTVRYQMYPGSYPNTDSGATTTNISRMKLDFEIPAGVTYNSASIVPGTGWNVNGLVAPDVRRIDSSTGLDSATGTVIRISGGNQVIANGADNKKNAEGGIKANKTKQDLNGNPTGDQSTWFWLPAIDVSYTVTAPAGSTIEPTVRSSNGGLVYGDDRAYNTTLARASFLGTQWAPTRCIPANGQGQPLNAGAGPLASIDVVNAVVNTTTSLTGPASVTVGDNASYTATVAPATATGNVEFFDGVTSLGTVPVSGGTATLNTSALTVGSHSITAQYLGDSGHNPSTSSAVSTTVNKKSTTTGLTGPASAYEGTSVTFTANITPAAATGTVEFFDGVTSLGSQPVSGGSASLSTSSLSVGSHSITGVYSGDSTHATSTSNVVTTNIVANSPGVIGGTITDESNSSPIPGATVYLLNGDTDTIITSTTTNGSGVYSFTGLNAGNYKLYVTSAGFRAAYNGSGFTIAGAPLIPVALNDNLTENVELRQWNTIQGKVFGANNVPQAGVQVRLFDANTNALLMGTTTDANGRYQFGQSFAIGTQYKLRYLSTDPAYGVTWNGNVATRADATAVTVGSGINKVDAKLRLVYSFTGKVTDRVTLAPINNARVIVFDALGNKVTRGWTDANGDYVITGLTAKNYWLAANVAGGTYNARWNNDSRTRAGAPYVNPKTAGPIDFALRPRTP